MEVRLARSEIKTFWPTGYYVYAYIRSCTSKNGTIGTPYYIGKGCRGRAWHRNNRRTKTPINTQLICIVAEGLTEIGALAIERRLIEWYGRVDQGTGMLHNHTDGGDTTFGLRHSQSTKHLMSQKAKGRKKSAEHIEKLASQLRGKKSMLSLQQLSDRGKRISAAKKGRASTRVGYKHTDATKTKIRESQQHLAYKHSETAKQKISERFKGRPWSEARRQAHINKKEHKI